MLEKSLKRKIENSDDEWDCKGQSPSNEESWNGHSLSMIKYNIPDSYIWDYIMHPEEHSDEEESKKIRKKNKKRRFYESEDSSVITYLKTYKECLKKKTGKNLCKNMDCKSCYYFSFVSNYRSNCWSIKNNISSRFVPLNTNKKYLFDCNGGCGHEFQQSPANINKGDSWCGYCSHTIMCFSDQCDFCYKNSFASHLMSKLWIYEKNTKTPREHFRNTNIVCVLKCNLCNHELTMKICDIVSCGHRCKYCSSNNSVLCKDENCNFCFRRCFANHEMIIHWSQRNIKNPRYLLPNSHNKYWFDCKICCHTFYSPLYRISSGTSFCPYCAHQKLCENQACKLCFNKSFAASSKLSMWSIKNKKSARSVFKNSNDKYWFISDCCQYIFISQVNTISNHTLCPLCKNKTEKMVFNWLNDNYEFIQRNVKYDWCKNKKTNQKLPFDLEITNCKIIIEIDGPQHFKDVPIYKVPFKKNQKRDIYKMNKAIKNSRRIIRISQEDIWNNKIDWKDQLEYAINNIQKGQVKYIALDKNLYDNHKKLMQEKM